MNDAIRTALAITPASTAWERTIEITTAGARSGLPHRIETWFYRVGDINYLSAMPGRIPDWFVNLTANPAFTFHLKHGVSANLKAVGSVVTDLEQRRRVFTVIVADLNQPGNPGSIAQPTSVKAWLDGSVLVAITFADAELGSRAADSRAAPRDVAEPAFEPEPELVLEPAAP